MAKCHVGLGKAQIFGKVFHEGGREKPPPPPVPAASSAPVGAQGGPKASTDKMDWKRLATELNRELEIAHRCSSGSVLKLVSSYRACTTGVADHFRKQRELFG